jgi:hypothetical protein
MSTHSSPRSFFPALLEQDSAPQRRSTFGIFSRRRAISSGSNSSPAYPSQRNGDARTGSGLLLAAAGGGGTGAGAVDPITEIKVKILQRNPALLQRFKEDCHEHYTHWGLCYSLHEFLDNRLRIPEMREEIFLHATTTTSSSYARSISRVRLLAYWKGKATATSSSSSSLSSSSSSPTSETNSTVRVRPVRIGNKDDVPGSSRIEGAEEGGLLLGSAALCLPSLLERYQEEEGDDGSSTVDTSSGGDDSEYEHSILLTEA